MPASGRSTMIAWWAADRRIVRARYRSKTPAHPSRESREKSYRPVRGQEPGSYCFYHRVIDRGTFPGGLFVPGRDVRIFLRPGPEITGVRKKFRKPSIAVLCIEYLPEIPGNDEVAVFCDGEDAEPEQGTVHCKRDLGTPHPNVVPGDAPGQLFAPC